jgi:TP901 family phage tail tape measure protein
MAPIDAGTIYSEVRLTLDKIKGDITKVETALDKFGKVNKQQSEKTTKTWKDGFGQINLAGVAAFAGISIAVKETVKTFATFEQSLANVKSVAQATDDEFLKIEKAALEAGETTRFKATEAADAMYYLASAGFDATQSVDALNGVLLLAGSTGSDLAQTAETVASTISQFNLEAEDAGRIANVFTAAITNSQATMDKLSVSLRYVGPVASSMNKSIEETTGLLQILYNNGFEASQAGTALRSALADLSNAASPANKRLKELGVSFDEVNPQTNSFADIIEVLNEKVTDGSDIMQIFGDRAGPALIKLIGAGREEVEKYTEAITGTNAAAEAYAIQNDTLQGSIDFLLSAVESAQIKFTKEFAPAIRGVIDFITGLVKVVSSIPGPLKVMIGIMTAAIPVVIGLMQAVKILSTTFTTTTGVIGAVVTVIALMAAFVIAMNDAKDAAGELADTLEDQRLETNKIVKEFNELNAKTSLNADEKYRLIELEGKLKSRLGETSLALDNETGKFKLNTDALKEYNEEQARAVVEARKAQLAVEERDVLFSEARLLRAKEAMGKLTEAERERLEVLKRSREINFNLLGFEELQAGLDYNKFLAEAYKKQADAQNDLKKAVDELAIAEQTLNDIQNPEQAAARAKAIEDARKAREDQIKKEQEAAERERAALKAYEEALNEITGIIDDEKGEYIKLLETLSRLEKMRFKSSNDEKKRLEAISIIRKKIAEEDKKQNKDAIKIQEDYQNKLDELRDKAQNTIELQRKNAREAVKASEATDTAKKNAIDAINAYYDALRDKTAQEEFEANNQKMLKSIEDGFFSLGGSITGLFSAIADARLRQIDAQLKAELEAAGVAEKSAVEVAQTELIEARKSGNAELILEKEKALKKAQIEEEFERKKANIRYQSEMAIWQITLAQTLAEAARAIVQAVASAPFPFNLPAIGFATVTGGLQTAAVAASKPEKPVFDSGGIVLPKGGNTGTDITVSRNGAAEIMFNAGEEGRPFARQMAGLIVQEMIKSGIPIQVTVQNQIDAIRLTEIITRVQNNGVVRVKT